jgi:hypothetical protein
VPENEIALCPACHTNLHTLGRATASARYGLGERVRLAEEAVRAQSLAQTPTL